MSSLVTSRKTLCFIIDAMSLIEHPITAANTVYAAVENLHFDFTATFFDKTRGKALWKTREIFIT